MLQRLFHFFIPADYQRDDVTIRVSRFIVLVSLSSVLFTFATAPILFWYFEIPVIGIALWLTGAFHALGLFTLRLRYDHRLAAGIHIVVQLALLFGLTLLFFTDRSVFYIWLPYTIIVTTFSLGRRTGAILVGALVAIVWQLEVSYTFGQPWLTQVLDNPRAIAISTSLALFMTGIAAWLFEMTHRFAEQRLYTSEQKLRLHVEQTPLAVLTCSLDGMITEWNPAAEHMFGYSRDEAIGKFVGEVILSDVQNEEEHDIQTTLWDVMAGRQEFHHVNRHRTKLGHAVYCEWFNTPLVEKDGSVVGVTSLVMDIGERLRAEEALRAGEARFRRLAEQSPDAIVIYDWTVERVIYTNRDVLLGHTWQEIESLEAILATIVAEDRSRIHQSWRAIEFAPEGADTRTNEFRVVNADGGIEWLRSRETVLTRNASGKPTQLLATITVITDEKRVEVELRRAKEEAERMAQMRSQFLANMSHEIRTPMNGIIGMTSLLMDADLKDDQRDFLETIRSSSEALLTIINEILDFSKIESGVMELETQPFDLRDCVEDALGLLATQAAIKGVELGHRFDRDVPHTYVGDVTRLRQILVNLLGNAIKFTAQGEVWLEVTRRTDEAGHDELVWAVRDTGIGIPAEKMPLLFNAFSQVDASSTRRYGGTGLGLAISQRLTELMGGKMWVESRLEQGSTFYFTLPLHGHAAPAPDAHAPLRTKRVLVVDANASSRVLLQQLLAQWDMQGSVVDSLAVAQDLLAGDQAWDVLVVADNTTNSRSLTQIGELRVKSALPIVLLASLANPAARTHAEALGVAGLLYKPLKPRDLMATLVAQLGGHAPAQRRGDDHRSALDHGLGVRHPLSILLAEDNLVNQKVATLILERLGYRADLAASGLEVLQAIHRQPYDVILMDVHMPVMDGIEATVRLLEQLPDQRRPYIIAMTAAAMQEDRERCQAAGMQDFISKPVQIDELVAALLRAEPWLARRNGSRTDGVPGAYAESTPGGT